VRDVAEHYSARENQRVDVRESSPIIHLKKLNNWIKSVLIRRMTPNPGTSGSTRLREGGRPHQVGLCQNWVLPWGGRRQGIPSTDAAGVFLGAPPAPLYYFLSKFI